MFEAEGRAPRECTCQRLSGWDLIPGVTKGALSFIAFEFFFKTKGNNETQMLNCRFEHLQNRVTL